MGSVTVTAHRQQIVDKQHMPDSMHGQYVIDMVSGWQHDDVVQWAASSATHMLTAEPVSNLVAEAGKYCDMRASRPSDAVANVLWLTACCASRHEGQPAS